MAFKLGKCYMHSSGSMLKIVGLVDTTTYGICLVAEEVNGNLKPVGMDNDASQYWSEVTEDMWKKATQPPEVSYQTEEKPVENQRDFQTKNVGIGKSDPVPEVYGGIDPAKLDADAARILKDLDTVVAPVENAAEESFPDKVDGSDNAITEITFENAKAK